MKRKPLKFIITCAGGHEELVAGEVREMGAGVIEAGRGLVSCTASLQTMYRICLWSRFSTRLLLVLAEYPAPDTDALYAGAGTIDWSRHFGADNTFAVQCTRHSSPISHSRFASLRVKDAVADWFRTHYYRRPSVDTLKPDILLHALLIGQDAQLCLDISGQSLHKRGYRAGGGTAPLKESLAAALVFLAGWSGHVPDNSVLIDPLCGSATMLIEAAFMYTDRAPNLERTQWGFAKWRGHNKAIWEDVVKEARERRKKGLLRTPPRIIGYDASRSEVRNALKNIAGAGLEGIIHVERRELARLAPPETAEPSDSEPSRFMLANPPYGQRIGSLDSLRYTYRCLGRKLREEFHGWRAGVFTGNSRCAGELGLPLIKQAHLYNGPLRCTLYLCDVLRPYQSDGSSPSAHLPLCGGRRPANDFESRIRKNVKALAPWASREGITCYRLYDRDLPEYNVSVDVYDTALHIQEYAPPKSVPPGLARKRLDTINKTLQDLFGISGEHIFIKRKQRQKGTSQYQRESEKGRLMEVCEHGCRFLVNLQDYLDTGLFLDHRPTRCMIRDMARGKTMCNLFGYTGTASVFAAAGGASTTTVDLSATYRRWAECNLALNGFSTENHTVVQADCLDWLKSTTWDFDLIFADPPTFSNTKSKNRVFDIQRHHPELIRLAARRLRPDGVLIFSTNFRRFSMDHGIEQRFNPEDITARTIPRDFERNPRIHRCWIIRREGRGK